MAGPILRLKDLIVHTGLSRSAIYDRMDKKSPRYAEDFPKSFSLSGGAVGWFQNEVDAWLEACAANPKGPIPSNTAKPSLAPIKPAVQAGPVSVAPVEVPRRPQRHSWQFVPSPVKTASQPPIKQAPQPGNLGEAIVQGSRINARLLHYLKLKSWTPAMGALLISGIEPPPGCIDIPLDAIGLDERVLHAGHERFHKARSILDEWQQWPGVADKQSLKNEPSDFLIWCVEKNITSEWFRFMLELTGCLDENAADLSGSRFALLTGKKVNL